MSAPIQPLDFIAGVKVVDIGDLRVARGMTRRPYSACKHLSLTYDQTERRIWCRDCETEVESFDAFMQLVNRHSQFDAKIERLQAAEKHTLFSRAGKTMDEAFRSRKMAPLCPHCKEMIFPEDVANGVGMGNKEMEISRRAARQAQGAKP
ncbi:hypothetical protein [Verticiella alkaliphila]|uniref:hypothetical protein n=1 Tax=Verticiella alkaliphila TaxID=2779529 RepID=UPI001C0E65EF|nr:hypothetical protein [Verticiella sp. GG226]